MIVMNKSNDPAIAARQTKVKQAFGNELDNLREASRAVDSVAMVMMHALKGVEPKDLEVFRSAVPDILKMLTSRLDELDSIVESVATLALDAVKC